MMSELGKQIEIEDVLSSIRRLVSEDIAVTHRRPAPEPAPAPVEAAELPEVEALVEAVHNVPEVEVECLVLTPAQRIGEAEAVAEAPEVAPEPEPEPEAPLALVDPAFDGAAAAAQEEDIGQELSRLESTIAQMEALVAENEIEFEPDEGHDFAPEGTEPLTELPPEVEAVEAAQAPDGAQEEAAMEADVAQSAEPVDELAEAVSYEAPGDPDLQDAAWAEADEALDWSDEQEAPTRLHLSDAHVEAPAAAGLRSSYESLREALAEDDLDAEFADIDAAEEGGPDLVAEGLIDEEMLRQMVAQMIRAELQGTLGERITRNVRKLVRREIQRALTSRDFE